MGIEWLNAIREALDSLGIRTEVGTPGRHAVEIAGTVAAVNLTGIDTAEGVMTVTVTVITPRAAGVLGCQEAAETAAAALAAQAGDWVCDGWRYDSAIDCYCIDLTGKRSVGLSGTRWVGAEGYEVLVGQTPQEFVTDFQASRMMDRRLYCGVSQSVPYGVTPAKEGWSVRLTQRIPWNRTEPEGAEEPFELTVRRGGCSQVFHQCCWSEYTSRQTQSGTELVRVGLALEREVIVSGSD